MRKGGGKDGDRRKANRKAKKENEGNRAKLMKVKGRQDKGINERKVEKGKGKGRRQKDKTQEGGGRKRK